GRGPPLVSICLVVVSRTGPAPENTVLPLRATIRSPRVGATVSITPASAAWRPENRWPTSWLNLFVPGGSKTGRSDGRPPGPVPGGAFPSSLSGLTGPTLAPGDAAENEAAAAIMAAAPRAVAFPGPIQT